MLRILASRLSKRASKVPGLHVLIRDPWKRNGLLALNDVQRNSLKPRSYPKTTRVNVTGLCNLRCSFCEIHYFYRHAQKVSGEIYPNFMDLTTIQAWIWLKYVESFRFETGAGEPFVNPHIIDMITYLRHNYPCMSLSVTTNGLLLGPKVRQVLVEQRFNSVSISLHAGSSEVYRSLQGGDFSRIVQNIRELISLRNQRGSSCPVASLNFALNKLNASSLEGLIYLAKELGVDFIYLYHYYNARNRLQADISFFFTPEEGNEHIRRAYSLAKSLGVKILPDSPPYLSFTQQEANPLHNGKQCYLPWTNIQFPPCLEEKDYHYVGVCNRVMLFKVDLNEWGAQFDFRSIWHHPLLQYLRKTVNSGERNPICRFCRNPNTPRIRCVNTAEYSRQRDKAVRDFFAAGRREFRFMPEWRGLYMLDRNPYEYDEEDWPV